MEGIEARSAAAEDGRSARRSRVVAGLRKEGVRLDKGPFFHGTKADLRVGDLLTAGFRSNYRPEIVMNHVYFTALPDGAGLAAELAPGDGPPRVYIVEPTGPFEDDPNVTDKRFPGNPTQSYRTRHPLRVVTELESWPGHSPEVLKGMLDRLAQLREQGLDVIED
jgi:hypothetical protein